MGRFLGNFGTSLVLQLWICYCFYYTANFNLYTGGCTKTANAKGCPRNPPEIPCMYGICTNTFLKEDGLPYLEVHHSIPLCRGGEDGLWNLSVLCAHHQRMAHFVNIRTRVRLENELLKKMRKGDEQLLVLYR